jgi:hypothetical protein
MMNTGFMSRMVCLHCMESSMDTRLLRDFAHSYCDTHGYCAAHDGACAVWSHFHMQRGIGKDHGFAYPDGRSTIEIPSSSAHPFNGLCASLSRLCPRTRRCGHREPLIELWALTGTYGSDYAFPVGFAFFRQRETFLGARSLLRPRCVHASHCSRPTI